MHLFCFNNIIDLRTICSEITYDTKKSFNPEIVVVVKYLFGF